MGWLRAALGRRRRGPRVGLLVVVLLVLPFVLTAPPAPASRVDAAVGAYGFRLLDWELAQLGARAGRMTLALVGGGAPSPAVDQATVWAYFAASPAERRALRPAAEAAIAEALSAIIQAEGLALPTGPLFGGAVVFPPVSFSFQTPPQVLVVSPRDAIRVERALLLRPDLEPELAERIEAGVDDERSVSLVVPVGGLATYPAMVLEGTGPQATFEAVAHEWVHGYLLFQPLGRRYWDDYAVRTLNETVAELAGRELGAKLSAAFGYEPPVRRAAVERATRRVPAPPDPYTAILRATRQEVDRLLAAGQVAEAEQHMERQRQRLLVLGYTVRKLNQAFFAFYGSYSEGGAAGFNPLPGRLEALREQSPSFAAWLTRVAQLTSPDDLPK